MKRRNEGDPAWQQAMVEMQRSLDQWGQGHPRATFAEIEGAVEMQLDALRPRLIEAQVARRSASGAEAPRPVCPECGHALQSQGPATRQVTVRGNRVVHLKRPYLQCPACRAGLSPPR